MTTYIFCRMFIFITMYQVSRSIVFLGIRSQCDLFQAVVLFPLETHCEVDTSSFNDIPISGPLCAGFDNALQSDTVH